jgi:hypothetical protein
MEGGLFARGVAQLAGIALNVQGARFIRGVGEVQSNERQCGE